MSYLSTENERWNSIRKSLSTYSYLVPSDRFGQIGLVLLFFFIIVGVVGPSVAPYDPSAINRDVDGQVLRTAPPSLDHPSGTTQFGRDVLSQLLLGARTSLIVGSVAAFITVFVGVNVGLLSAYYGGVVDSILMRITDIAYALPFLPFALVFISIVSPNMWTIIFAISFLLWRNTARVIRSQVLSHKERPYVESAKAIGSSDFRIMYLHILPNVLPLAALYAAFSVAWAIIIEANISFLGFGDPERYSWGKMIFQAYNADVLPHGWWWALPPGFLVMLLVIAVFLYARSLEKVVQPDLSEGGAR